MSSAPMPTPDPSVLCLKLQPRWSFIDELRRFTESFCAAACPGAEREEELGLAVHELVQNALANATGPDVEVELAIDAAAERVGVAVTNRCAPEQAALLRARVERLQGERDPLQAYLRTIEESTGTRGGLGLARVRYEAALDLDVTTEGDRVTVHASGALHPHVRPC